MMMMMITPLPFSPLPPNAEEVEEEKNWTVWTCCSTHPCTIPLASGVLALKESSKLCFYKENGTLLYVRKHTTCMRAYAHHS